MSTTKRITGDYVIDPTGVMVVRGNLVIEGNVTAADIAAVPSGVTVGTYGSASQAPTVTVDINGRITSASNTAINIASSQVSNFAATARTSVSANSGLTYNSTTGVFGVDSSVIPSTASGGAALVGYTAGGTGAVTTTVQAKLRESVSVKDFGAVGDGVTDDTVALSNAIATAFSGGKRLVIDMPTYIKKLIVSVGSGEIVCEGNGKILPHNSALQTDIYDSQLLTFGAGVTDSTFSLVFDMRGFSKSACLIQGSNCRIPYCRIENIEAAVGRTNQLWGLCVSGDDVKIGRIEGVNLNSVSTMNSGGTTLAIIAYAENTEVDHIYSKGGFCAYLGNGRSTTIGTIYVEDCTDNGIYSIAGSENFICGEIVARNCSDEVVIFSGDDSGTTLGNSNPYIGKVICYDCGRGVGFYKTTNARVGVIEWHVSSGAVDSGSPLYIRPTQTTKLDRISVEELRIFGTWKTGAPIWTLDHGGVEELNIGKITARLIYDDATLSRTTTLGFSGAPIDSVRIGEIDIIVADGTGGLLTSAQIFRLNLPIALTKPSSIDSVELSSNGGTHQVRLINPIQDVMRIGGVASVFTTADPPYIYAADGGQITRTYGAGAVPSQGTWKRGDIIFHQFPSAAGSIGWVCVASGTPGTWKTFGAISA